MTDDGRIVGMEEDSAESWARTTSLGGEPLPALPLPALALPLPALPGAPKPTTAPRREPSTALPAAPTNEGWRLQIGRYVLLRTLGEGGMGVVWAAYDPELDRKVALKILREGVLEGSIGALRMRREAQAMARLSHPNVAQVYEVGEDGGRLFLAIEYIEGATLKAWLQQAPRSWREVLRVFGEAGRGLAAAHAAGLMHRDFKPETWSPPRTAPHPPTGRILKNRGDLRGDLRRQEPRRAAVLATAWQRTGRSCSRI